ncbi:MAG: SPOR domain-containing protein [Pseudomonadota bacterium]
MQDSEEYPYDPPPDRSARFGRMKSIISTAVGAAIAMSLLMALGVWFYRLGVRDAENVPIIRAALTPEKERPENPGGAVTPHQGVAAYEVTEGDTPQAAAVVLAPEPPQPSDQDLPMGQIVPEPPSPPATVVAEAAGPGGDPDAEIPAPVVEGEVEAEAPEAPAEDPAPVVLTGTEFAPSDSPIARARPQNLEQLNRQAVEWDRQAEGDLATRAANSAVQIQLAADPDEIVIRRLWDRIQRANNDLLTDRALAVQTTTSGGIKFYRLRVGPFRDGSEARAICQALKARGQDCIVVRNG